MHGVSEINTEEGLWRFSNGYVDYDRFSKPCKDHLNVQSRFNDFVSRNERRGRLKTDIAMLMGRYDGNDCFSAPQVFGHSGEEWKKGAPEKSWELLKLFYPDSDINSTYYYIINGGTLMLAKVHLYSNLNRKEALCGNCEILKSPYTDKLLSYTESGRVIYFDSDRYPSDYSENYAAALRKMAEKFGGKNVRSTERISYTEYETDRGVRIYLQNIGWWTDEPASCELRINNKWERIYISDFDIKIIDI